MAEVRKVKTKAENQVAKLLQELAIGYRRNVKSLPGAPDFANQKRKWAIFVNGCFWHHHSACRKATIPKTNTEFWVDKFRANRRRDARAITALRRRGFKVLVVWECESEDVRERLLQQIPKAGRIDG